MNIFFISYRESNCEDNWQRLLNYHKDSKRIHGIEGIDKAHCICNDLSTTDFFWTVDGDNWLINKLEFKEFHDYDLIMFNSLDPLYDQKTLLGGVKLWKKNSIINKTLDKIDFCLNATKNKRVVDQIFSITKYNDQPFDCWKTSFRHCVKLSSCIFRDRPYSSNIDSYLEKWKNTKNLLSKNANWAYQGYLDGIKYAEDFDYNFIELGKINDYSWLENYFNQKGYSNK